jgi:hypothetical protein
MTPPEVLVRLFQPWNDFYSHSKAMETAVIFLHIGGLLLAGGLAIAADRSTLRALRVAANSRDHHIAELGAVHRWVLTGLTLVVVSGLALLASDIETFWASWIYWVKMLLVALLLLNGLIMTRAEAGLAKDPSDASPHWRSLHRAAVISLALWFATTLAGVALANFA